MYVNTNLHTNMANYTQESTQQDIPHNKLSSQTTRPQLRYVAYYVILLKLLLLLLLSIHTSYTVI